MINVKEVVKNDGRREPFDPDKMYEKLLLAQNGDLKRISVSEVMIRASHIIGKNRKVVKSSEIQESLIKASEELFRDEPEYEIFAGRLVVQKMRKEVYGSFHPRPFYDEVKKRVERGYYDPGILKKYTEEEIEYFGNRIIYSRDLDFRYVGIMQFLSKYAVKRNGKPLETPQEVFMLIPMYVFADRDPKTRKRLVLEGYRTLSTMELVLPTPVISGVRTRKRAFISCNGISFGDSSESISNAFGAIPKMVAARSGLGFDFGYIRGEGADIDGGRVKHLGIVPIAKAADRTKLIFTQETRHGSATGFMPYFNWDFDENFLNLKNPRVSEEKNALFMDYAAVLNKTFYERAKRGEEVTLFHMNRVPGLYDVVGFPDKFEELYESYEKSVPRTHKKSVSARKLLKKLAKERFETMRFYVFNAHRAQEQSNYEVPVRHSNLCMEIVLPSRPLEEYETVWVGVAEKDVERYEELRRKESPEAYSLVKRMERGRSVKPESGLVYFQEKITKDGKFYRGEVFSCILSSVNMGVLTEERMERVSYWIVNFLDDLIDYMDYALPEIEYASKKRRALGIGVFNLFYFLAKNRVFYNDAKARDLVHSYMEKLSYWLHRASCDLAKEKGACDLYGETKFPKGSLIIDRYERKVDELVTNPKLEMNWEELRENIKRYGMRNSSLLAIAPTSNASRLAGGLQGINPPWDLFVEQSDSKMTVGYWVPEAKKYSKWYVTAFSPKFDDYDYFRLIAVMNKFVDQSISLNQYFNMDEYEEGKIPVSEIAKRIVFAEKHGIVSLYYVRIHDSRRAGEERESGEDEGCAGGSCHV